MKNTNSVPSLVVVTGASSGIGAGVVAAAERDDVATIATVSRSELDRPRHLASDLSTEAGWDAYDAWLGDLIGSRSWQSLTLVHAAATLEPIGFAGAVDADDYRRAVVLNGAAPQVIGDLTLRAAGGLPATLVMISSGAGKHEYPGWSSYCAGKAALDMWVRAVAAEGQRTLALNPGVVATAMQAEIRAADAAAFPSVERFKDLHRDGALADPDDVGAQVWAISQRTDWESGTVAGLDL